MRTRKILLRIGTPIKVLAFILLFVFMFQAVTNLFRIKREYNSIAPLYDLPKDDIDVLLFGSSHINSGILPLEIWDKYGITSFNAGTGDSTIMMNYYEMREIFRVCHPKVAVLDIYRVYLDKKLSGRITLHYFTDNVPISAGVIEGIHDMLPERRDKTEYYLNLYSFHNRWKELTEADFRPDAVFDPNMLFSMGAYMGFYVSTVPTQEPEWIPKDQTEEIPELNREYLLKIIELCRSENIPLLLTTLPYGADQKNQGLTNAVEAIAREEGVPFLNYLDILDEIGFDFMADLGPSTHLNYKGAVKASDRLGEYLKEHYDLEDRRGNSKIAKIYNKSMERYRINVDDLQLRQEREPEGYFNYINSRDYVVMWNAFCDNGLASTGFDALMLQAGFSETASENAKSYCALTRKGETLFDKASSKQINHSEAEADTLFSFGKGLQASQAKNGVHVGAKEYSKGQSDLNIVVFDPRINAVIDSVNINLDTAALTR